VQPPEVRRAFRRYERKLERDLKKARPRLFQALQDFAIIRADMKAWAHFSRRWPDFFPEGEYRRAVQGLRPSILDYPYWLEQIWIGGETDPQLRILLGIEDAPLSEDEGTPEESWLVGLATIPAQMEADWDEGVFRYRGALRLSKSTVPAISRKLESQDLRRMQCEIHCPPRGTEILLNRM
jgi:hypothetical protein